MDYEDRAVDTNVTDVTTRKRRIKFIEKFPKISRMYWTKWSAERTLIYRDKFFNKLIWE